MIDDNEKATFRIQCGWVDSLKSGKNWNGDIWWITISCQGGLAKPATGMLL
jgi:hypothetical protein